nr:F0F1 ATP synthase subunit gamma [Guyparkeria hydrothermalis]
MLALRHQIESARDLQSVVQTMKALSASSIGQFEESVRALEDYHRTVTLGLAAALRGKAGEAVPAPAGNRGERVRVAIVFGSDQGLAGQFNERIAAVAGRRLGGEGDTLHLWAVGERVEARLLDLGLAVQGRFDVPAGVHGVGELVGRLLLANEDQLGDTEATELHLFHNRPGGDAPFEPTHRRLLPLDRDWLVSLRDQPWPTNNLPEVMGEGGDTLRALLREYLFVTLFRACAESLASENAARLAAMQRADRNIEDMLERLETRFHHQRQSGIDAELFDLIASFEALG